ncbi:MAG: glucosidase [Planctomycetes bacterium]|nr:glucosidase [Planctomycetota bacterium]
MPPWRKWGPYVSDRAWATVREDYSPGGTAWDYFPHDLARSKAYRWGEDGIAAWCDRYQLLVFAPAFWNGKDAILKERLFGLVPSEGNHGEDVKELYYHLDGTPTHSYMKYLYKYPQAEFPYGRLIDESRRLGTHEGEFEILDTGVFDDDRYFDVFVEYAKGASEDTCIRIEAWNRGRDPATLHLIPRVWFRNRWAWGATRGAEPRITPGPTGKGWISLAADDSTAEPMTNLPFPYALGTTFLYAQADGRLLFTNNETNCERLYGTSSPTRFVKDAFHRHIVNGENCVNPDKVGTCAAVHYGPLTVPPGKSVVIRLRLTSGRSRDPIGEVDAIVAKRRREADEFYDAIQPPRATEDERRVQRQAIAGMLWSKQFYFFDVKAWQDGDNPNLPPPESRRHTRNVHWRHLNSMRILAMPDKWEYPWFAAWDLAFHAVTIALVDPDFAKEQLWLLLFEQFQHPNGQIPAYEWEFSDMNPPVQAWAIWRVYNMERLRWGKSDRTFLEQCFHKLLINFAWWVNKVDSEGNNVFEGGFLGLDNITVIDRSHEIPGGAKLEQSDATGWMGHFCLTMMRIALELAKENTAYESLATKFFQHYIYIGSAMKKMGRHGYQLWDSQDEFFYDVLRYPSGEHHKFRLRSLVGLIPLYAVERLEEKWIERFQGFRTNLEWFIRNRQDIVQHCVTTHERDGDRIHVLAIIDREQIRGLLKRVWDPAEFRSYYGLRSLSKFHEAHPFSFGDSTVGYEPGEARERLKGGNSNWRGPIWFPTTFLMIESLRKLAKAHGDDFTVQSVVDGGAEVSLNHVAEGIAESLIRLFTRDGSGRRAIHGDNRKLQEDPHFKDHLLFHEYFHGDTGKGLGASHQTGWTGLIANVIDEWRS